MTKDITTMKELKILMDQGRDKTFTGGVQVWLLLEVINSIHM